MMEDNSSEESEVLSFLRSYHELPQKKSQHLMAIVSSHLLVEHYLDMLLAASYPGFPFDQMRLSYDQKLKAIEPDLFASMPSTTAGLKTLGTIRNRIAHSLHAEVTVSDLAPIRRALQNLESDLKFEAQSVHEIVHAFAKYIAMLVDIWCVRLKKTSPFGVEGWKYIRRQAQKKI